MNSTNTSNKAYSVDEFCKSYKFGRSLFYKLLREGKGPKVIKIGRRTIIPADEAEQWFSSLIEG